MVCADLALSMCTMRTLQTAPAPNRSNTVRVSGRGFGGFRALRGVWEEVRGTTSRGGWRIPSFEAQPWICPSRSRHLSSLRLVRKPRGRVASEAVAFLSSPGRGAKDGAGFERWTQFVSSDVPPTLICSVPTDPIDPTELFCADPICHVRGSTSLEDARMA